jgi:hypothetical protein
MKTTFKLAAIFTLFIALAFTACGAAGGGGEPGKTYAIGDLGPSGNGYVFYVSHGGVHGLDAPFHDQTATPLPAWSTITDGYASGSSPLPTAIGTGSANTAAIIAQNSGAASAAQVCADCRVGDLTDWFLPSLDELYQLYIHREILTSLYPTAGFSDVKSYWSSSEQATDIVKCYYFGSGDGSGPNISAKNDTGNVRAVRAF